MIFNTVTEQCDKMNSMWLKKRGKNTTKSGGVRVNITTVSVITASKKV